MYDKTITGGYRPIRYSDIVILSKTITGVADTFVDILMSQGYPHTVIHQKDILM